MREYITPEDYAIAEANGIPAHRVAHRIQQNGWSKQRAITTPVNDHLLSPKVRHYLEKALENGVHRNTFRNRLNRGIAPEDAWKTQKKSDMLKPWVELALSNGIKYSTFFGRVNNYKWTYEEAATIPVGKRKPKSRKAVFK